MRAAPAGRLMKVRTMGSMRLKKMAGAPQRANQRSATSSLWWLSSTYLP